METVEKTKSKKGIISLILGIIGLIAWALPIIGAPVTIVGLIFGIKGYNTNHKKLATAGIVLCIVGLFATVVNGAIGSYKGSTGTLFNSNTDTFNTNPTQTNTVNNSNAQTSTNNSVKMGEVIFCENVDDNLTPAGTATTFSVGQVYALLTSSQAFNAAKIKVAIYRMSGASETLLDNLEQDANQDWGSFAIPVTFDSAGNYKIIFTRSSDGQKLGEGTVTIQ